MSGGDLVPDTAFRQAHGDVLVERYAAKQATVGGFDLDDHSLPSVTNRDVITRCRSRAYHHPSMCMSVTARRVLFVRIGWTARDSMACRRRPTSPGCASAAWCATCAG